MLGRVEEPGRSVWGGQASRQVLELAGRTGWAWQGTGDMTVTDREAGGHTLSLTERWQESGPDFAVTPGGPMLF